ncbi:nucleoside/nucleotide kinase family protein [Dawidia soli]|uniref:DUF4249 family protein n=1 Tax=Dawidia soli TaxID=2782352 RepID=A0AAP2DGR3_9BACT|nr:hypothetical protein [Dawidia soli]MBT1690540.1 hypothetical protein [Dawidia soli]
MNDSFSLKRLWPLSLTLLLAASFSACDVLEDDDPIGGGKGVVIDDSDVKMLAQGTAFIDLYARVKTERPIRLDITAEPGRGTLRELRTGLLQYQPRYDFTEGRDSFRVSVYAEDNTLLLEDTVGIVIEDDTTNLPCGVYTRSDSAHVWGDTTVYIYPLANDVLCGDTTRYRIEIYQPNGSQPPRYGTAMLNTPYNSISYAPTSNPPKDDMIVYKVYDTTDTTRMGYGVIFIRATSGPVEPPEQPCQFALIDDAYTLLVDSLKGDSVNLRPFENDVLCDSSSRYTLDIAQQPAHGWAASYNSGVVYKPVDEPYRGMRDSLVYRGCRGDTCRTATIRIYFH